jgi:hypothetical protein
VAQHAEGFARYNGTAKGDHTMNAVRIRRKLDSDTLHLPELKPLIGKDVEIIVLEDETRSTILPGTGDWEAAARAAEELRESGYDFDASKRLREYDLEHAKDHLP